MIIIPKILVVYTINLNILNSIRKFLLNILLYSVFFNTTGQVTAKISQPQLALINDSLIIKYNILDATPKDKFNIWLEITDDTGVKINAFTFTGDIGDSVKGGLNKEIIWDLSADNIILNNNINVEIIAKKIVVPEIGSEEVHLSEIPSDLSKKENIEEKKEIRKVIEEPIVTAPKVKVGKHLLQSAILPGWGLTKLSKGKPYWLIGVAGAGCIASSIYFNNQAYLNYNKYLDSYDEEKIDTYFNNAKTQDNISKAFALTAVAIWVTDLAIVNIKATSMNKSYRRNRLNDISISSGINLNTEIAMLSLHFNF
jgi:hypothetical protein